MADNKTAAKTKALAGGEGSGTAKQELKAFVERVERLEEERKAISEDIKDVYGEAKAHGFDTKAMRTIVRLRKLDQDERKEAESILETYMLALGML